MDTNTDIIDDIEKSQVEDRGNSPASKPKKTSWDIEDFFKAAGFRNEDTIIHASKDSSGRFWRPVPQTVENYADYIQNTVALPKHNFYYSHATHCGEVNERYIAILKEDFFNEIVCLVIDIDYGVHHHDAFYKDLPEARTAAAILPRPTVVIHSGGGLQLVYRFRNRLNGLEGRSRYKAVYRTMGGQVHSDSCQGIGHCFRLPFTVNYKDGVEPRSVEILEMNPSVDYTLEELEKYCREHHFSGPSQGKVKASLIAVKKARKKKRKTGPDNSKDAFFQIDSLLNLFPNMQERYLMAKLKTKPCYEHYRKFGKDADKRCRQDIRRIRIKLTKEKRPSPPNKVKKLKYENELVSELVCQKRSLFNEIYDTSANERITIALSLMEKLYLDRKKAILNFPCASGKSTSAMIIASAYASSENRFWIVTKKIEEVRHIAKNLRQLGTNVQEWHGRPRECSVDYYEFLKARKGEFCRKCAAPCTAQKKYVSRDIWDYPEADILVTTHAHWAAAVIQDKIPSSVKYVIVDESPSLMEFFLLNQEKMDSFRNLFSENKKLLDIFDVDITFLRNMLSDGGCKRIPQLSTLFSSEDIRKCLYKLLDDEKIAPETFEQMQIFLDFFSSSEIYGMQEFQNGRWNMTFIRGQVNLHTKIPHILLDGSALMSDVKWEDFSIYTCGELKQEYPNTTVEVINGNPSKTFLANPENFSLLAERVLRTCETNTNLLLFHNKELDRDTVLKENITRLRDELRNRAHVNLIEMNRGEHIGSNKGRLAQVTAVCMSLFNNIAYYVLRTALVTHSDVLSENIWNERFKYPAMKRNGGFSFPALQLSYCRAIAIDLYQTIMRGCIRDNPSERYKVICILSGLDIITVLQEELPGAVFHYENEEIVRALLEGTSDSEIIRYWDAAQSEQARYEKLGGIKKAVGL